MTPDVNVLVAAARSDHPHHKPALEFLEGALGACALGATLKLMPMVVASFLRLVTHPKIFVQPMPMADAMAFVDALLAVPGVEISGLGAEWPIMRKLCLGKKLASNDIPDVWLAAAVVHFDEQLATFDSDFRRLLPASQLTLLAA
jgi:toxin-antitoxin system PIN domain toxin